MNKTMTALAVAAITAAPAFAVEFQPAPGTKFEVNVEVGAYQQSLKNANGLSRKQWLGSGLNQIEIKAEHKLSDDLSVFGEIEVDYDPIVDNNPVQTDDTRLGLNSKSLGRFTFGQFDSYFEDNLMEILGVTHGDKAFVTEPGSNNDGRHFQWTKGFGDLTVAIDFMSSNNVADSSLSATTAQKNRNGNALTLAYKLGDLTLLGGASKIAGFKSDTGAAQVSSGKAKSVNALGARYRLGDLTLLALSAKEKLEASSNTNKYNGAAFSYRMGEFDVGVSFQKVKLGTAASRNEISYGVGYTPIKNMTFFADAAKLKKAKGEGDVVEIGVKYAF